MVQLNKFAFKLIFLFFLLKVIRRHQCRQTYTLLTDYHSSLMYPWFVFWDRIRVCQGPYDPSLIQAWEDWDEKHSSENDHPKEFPEKQVSHVHNFFDKYV